MSESLKNENMILIYFPTHERLCFDRVKKEKESLYDTPNSLFSFLPTGQILSNGQAFRKNVLAHPLPWILQRNKLTCYRSYLAVCILLQTNPAGSYQVPVQASRCHLSPVHDSVQRTQSTGNLQQNLSGACSLHSWLGGCTTQCRGAVCSEVRQSEHKKQRME